MHLDERLAVGAVGPRYCDSIGGVGRRVDRCSSEDGGCCSRGRACGRGGRGGEGREGRGEDGEGPHGGVRALLESCRCASRSAGPRARWVESRPSRDFIARSSSSSSHTFSRQDGRRSTRPPCRRLPPAPSWSVSLPSYLSPLPPLSSLTRAPLDLARPRVPPRRKDARRQHVVLHLLPRTARRCRPPRASPPSRPPPPSCRPPPARRRLALASADHLLNAPLFLLRISQGMKHPWDH